MRPQESLSTVSPPVLPAGSQSSLDLLPAWGQAVKAELQAQGQSDTHRGQETHCSCAGSPLTGCHHCVLRFWFMICSKTRNSSFSYFFSLYLLSLRLLFLDYSSSVCRKPPTSNVIHVWWWETNMVASVPQTSCCTLGKSLILCKK